METTLDIKKKIHEFIEQADERMLRVFNGIIVAEQEEPNVPESFYEKLDIDREKHLKKETESYSWVEVKNRLL